MAIEMLIKYMFFFFKFKFKVAYNQVYLLGVQLFPKIPLDMNKVVCVEVLMFLLSRVRSD